GGGTAANLLPGHRTVRIRGKLRALLQALRHQGTLPRRPMPDHADLEPPVVPGLPAALHPAVAGGGSAAAAAAGTAGEPGGLAVIGRPDAGAADPLAAWRPPVAGPAFSGNPRPVRRLDRPCRIPALVPARLHPGHRRTVPGLDAATALENAGGGDAGHQRG